MNHENQRPHSFKNKNNRNKSFKRWSSFYTEVWFKNKKFSPKPYHTSWNPHTFIDSHNPRYKHPYRKKKVQIPQAKPPSPLPGSEEYRNRSILEKSDYIKQQLNLTTIDDGPAYKKKKVVFNENNTKPCNKIDCTKKSNIDNDRLLTNDKKLTKNLKHIGFETEKRVSEQEIYKKILDFLANLSHEKKKKLINSEYGSYDTVCHQTDVHKRALLSQVLREFISKQTNSDALKNYVIPDVGVKIEDLPIEFIHELNKLGVGFEDDINSSKNLDANMIHIKEENLTHQTSKDNKEPDKMCDGLGIHFKDINSSIHSNSNLTVLKNEKSTNQTSSSENSKESDKMCEFSRLYCKFPKAKQRSLNIEMQCANNLECNKLNRDLDSGEKYLYKTAFKKLKPSTDVYSAEKNIKSDLVLEDGTEDIQTSNLHSVDDLCKNEAETVKTENNFDNYKNINHPFYGNVKVEHFNENCKVLLNLDKTEKKSSLQRTIVTPSLFETNIKECENSRHVTELKSVSAITKVDGLDNTGVSSFIPSIITDSIVSQSKQQIAVESCDKNIEDKNINEHVQEKIPNPIPIPRICIIDKQTRDLKNKMQKEKNNVKIKNNKKQKNITAIGTRKNKYKKKLQNNFASNSETITAIKKKVSVQKKMLNQISQLDSKIKALCEKRENLFKQLMSFSILDVENNTTHLQTSEEPKNKNIVSEKKKNKQETLYIKVHCNNKLIFKIPVKDSDLHVLSNIKCIPDIVYADTEINVDVKSSHGLDMPEISVNCEDSGLNSNHARGEIRYEEITGNVAVIQILENCILAGSTSGIAYIYDIETGKLIETIKVTDTTITSIITLQTNNLDNFYVGTRDPVLRIYNSNNKLLSHSIEIDDGIQCMDFSWDYIFIGSCQGSIVRFSTLKNKTEFTMKISERNVLALKAAQEGARRVLLVGLRDSNVYIRDAMSGLLMRNLCGDQNRTVYSIQLHNNQVYCGNNENDVFVYRFSDGEFISKLHTPASRSVTFLEISGNLLFVGCYNGKVFIFDIKTNLLIDCLVGPEGILLAMKVFKNRIFLSTKSCFVSWSIPEHCLNYA